ncbi:MAG TPA: molybdenum cofactor biosynthesis protein MoaE [Proteobacteria bacterium]|nr:molybdenum cofactor biosynthesis protein MoaE [Pseudomonadota bacterium]
MSAIIEAYTTEQPFEFASCYHAFQQQETDATGTVVIHHGKVKYPGKQVVAFSHVVLSPLIADPDAALTEVGRKAANQCDLHQVFIAHRLGVVGRGDDVLLVIASAATRKQAFAGCAWIVDEIKRENIIQLIERT